MGRIGLDIYRSDPNVILASVEASDLLPDDLSIPGPGVYRSDDGGETWRYLLRHTSRPMYHGRIAVNPLDDDLIYVIARDFRFSKDGGKAFQGKPWRGAGGDDHDLWISPRDKNVFYTASDQGAHLTIDGGKSFLSFDNMAIVQYYAIGVDMRDPYWIYGGMQDIGGFGTPSNSRDEQGILTDHSIEVNGGDGFHMQVDPTDWRTVYTVCHVGGIGRIDMLTRETKYISPRPETIVNFEEFFDPDFPETPIRYSIFPGESWLWREPSRSSYSSLLPPQFRFNWSTPLIVSPHNPRTIYVGGNHLFQSVDRGDTWRIISPDLTANDPDKRNSSESGGLTHEVTGAENHCTIISISESTLIPGLIWVGTDDGKLQITRDGGGTWFDAGRNIPEVPQFLWISRVEASHHFPGTAYITIDGHRSDDFKPYVFKTDDFGKTWKNISSDLPDGNSLYVVREDYLNPDLLFVGSEFACFASIDGGGHWGRFMNEMPTVAFHDLVIHPRDYDLVAGTHGRSLWIADDITPLQQLTSEIREKELHLFQPRAATRRQMISLGRQRSYFKFRGENPPYGAAVHYYLKNRSEETPVITISDISGRLQTTLKGKTEQGIHKTIWNMRFPPAVENVLNFKLRMREVLSRLDQMVKTSEEKSLIEGLIATLDRAQSDRDLNRVHREITRNFGAYSEGRDLFGDRLQDIEAAAGTYLISITWSGPTERKLFKIRDDPILKQK